METLLSWLIKSFIVSGSLFLFYHVALRNKRFHLYNRFFLLGAVIISILAPSINFTWPALKAPHINILNFFLNGVNNPSGSVRTTGFFYAERIIISCMVVVSLVLLATFLLKIVWVFKTKAKGESRAMQGFYFIETEVKQAPFSFLNNLFWKKGMSTSDVNSEKILQHEMVHIQGKHTYDKLFCQLVACVCWINPFYWLIQKELNVIHEFLADEKCIENGDTESFAMMLLHSYNNGSYLNPSHSFFNSSVKRRLMMITLSASADYSYIRKVLALPVALFLLSVISLSAKIETEHIPATRHLKTEPFRAGTNYPNNDQIQKQHAEKLAAEKAALRK